MSILSRIREFIFRHSGNFASIVAEVKKALPAVSKLRSMSDAERREAIVSAVELVIDTRYPAFAPFSHIVIEFLVQEVRHVLRRRIG